MLFQTPFVRHNTPHPKDLKAKAQKLMAGRSPEAVAQKKAESATANGLLTSPIESVPVPVPVPKTVEVSS